MTEKIKKIDAMIAAITECVADIYLAHSDLDDMSLSGASYGEINSLRAASQRQADGALQDCRRLFTYLAAFRKRLREIEEQEAALRKIDEQAKACGIAI